MMQSKCTEWRIKMVNQYTDNDLNRQIETGELTLVDFYADWCGPCRQMAPIIEKIADGYEGRLTVGKVDTMQYPQLSDKYRIVGIPLLILFKNGEIADKILGLHAEEDITAVIEKHL